MAEKQIEPIPGCTLEMKFDEVRIYDTSKKLTVEWLKVSGLCKEYLDKILMIENNSFVIRVLFESSVNCFEASQQITLRENYFDTNKLKGMYCPFGCFYRVTIVPATINYLSNENVRKEMERRGCLEVISIERERVGSIRTGNIKLIVLAKSDSELVCSKSCMDKIELSSFLPSKDYRIDAGATRDLWIKYGNGYTTDLPDVTQLAIESGEESQKEL